MFPPTYEASDVIVAGTQLILFNGIFDCAFKKMLTMVGQLGLLREH